MDGPTENAPSVLEWGPRIDVVGGDAANRVAPELESMGGGAAGGGGDSDDDCSAAATHAFKGMPTEELAVRKNMAIGELASQKRKERVANTRRRNSSAQLNCDGSWYTLGTAGRGVHSKAKKAWANYNQVVTRAADNWDHEVCIGAADPRKRAARLQGRPPASPTIGEVALEWFIGMRENNLARVTPEMVIAEVAVAADAIRSRQATAGEVETSYSKGRQDFVKSER